MGRIFCIAGKSGVGKDTLYNALVQENIENLDRVVSFTTRPKRRAETDGVEYNFVTAEQMGQYERSGRILERRKYRTVEGDWYYFTLDIDLSGGRNYILITTLDVIEVLYHRYGAENVFVFYLHASDRVRLERSINREELQAHPNYVEVCRRFLADEEDFRKEKLSALQMPERIDTELDIKENIRRMSLIVSRFTEKN